MKHAAASINIIYDQRLIYLHRLLAVPKSLPLRCSAKSAAQQHMVSTPLPPLLHPHFTACPQSSPPLRRRPAHFCVKHSAAVLESARRIPTSGASATATARRKADIAGEPHSHGGTDHGTVAIRALEHDGSVASADRSAVW